LTNYQDYFVNQETGQIEKNRAIEDSDDILNMIAKDQLLGANKTDYLVGEFSHDFLTEGLGVRK